MQQYQLGEWLIAIDPLRGNVCRMEKMGCASLSRARPCYLAVDDSAKRPAANAQHRIIRRNWRKERIHVGSPPRG